MTDTDPHCQVCDAELIEETRHKSRWKVVVSGVRGGHKEADREGWEFRREFGCGAVLMARAETEPWTIERQCNRAHEIAVRLKRQMVKLAARAGPPLPDVDPGYGEETENSPIPEGPA